MTSSTSNEDDEQSSAVVLSSSQASKSYSGSVAGKGMLSDYEFSQPNLSKTSSQNSQASSISTARIASIASNLYYLDRAPIVLHFGRHFTRAGIGGDECPYVVLDTYLNYSTSFQSYQASIASGISSFSPTTGSILSPRALVTFQNNGGKGGKATRYLNESRSLPVEKWYTVYTPLLHKIFYQILQTNTKERQVIINEGMHTSEEEKRAIVDILFINFEIPSISFVPDIVTPLYTCGISTGIVVDVGFSGTRVLATAEGFPITNSFVCTNVGGSSVDAYWLKLLKRSVQGQRLPASTMTFATYLDSLSLETIENLKIKTCYVYYNLKERKKKENGGKERMDEDAGNKHVETIENIEEDSKSIHEFATDQDVIVSLDDDIHLTIPHQIRWKACEILFGKDDDENIDADIPIQTAILECIQKVPNEMRKQVCQNLVLCGGTSEFRGFSTRLALELEKEVNYYPKLKCVLNYMGYGVPSFSPSLRSWIGASIHSILEGKQEYTREDYLSSKSIPDWTTWQQPAYSDDPAHSQYNLPATSCVRTPTAARYSISHSFAQSGTKSLVKPDMYRSVSPSLEGSDIDDRNDTDTNVANSDSNKEKNQCDEKKRDRTPTIPRLNIDSMHSKKNYSL